MTWRAPLRDIEASLSANAPRQAQLALRVNL
jgi:hypothetical protein